MIPINVYRCLYILLCDNVKQYRTGWRELHTPHVFILVVRSSAVLVELANATCGALLFTPTVCLRSSRKSESGAVSSLVSLTRN